MATPITLSGNLQIAADAPSGSVIGTFNADGLALQTNPFGLFIIVGRLLCARWITRGIPGSQPIQVQGPTGSASFTIAISVPAPAAVPTQITLSPAAASMPDNAVAGTKIATAAVKMSDGSVFSGLLSVSPVGLAVSSGFDLVLGRALTAADDGSRSFTVTATQNGVAVSAALTLAITRPAQPGISPDGSTSAPPNGPALITTAGTWTWAGPAAGRAGEYNINLNGAFAPGIGNLMVVADKGQLYQNTAGAGWYVWNNGFTRSPGPGAGSPVPKSVTLTPPSATLPDTSSINTVVAKAAVTMSDGSAYTGALTVAPAGMIASSGMNLVLSRALAAADDGAHSLMVTATQGGIAAGASLLFTVVAAAPPPPRTLVLSLGAVSQPADDSAAGLVLGTATVTYQDGTVPAKIILNSSDPAFVTFNGMQLVLARALTPADDGIHHVAITASDGLGAFATMRVFGGGDEI